MKHLLRARFAFAHFTIKSVMTFKKADIQLCVHFVIATFRTELVITMISVITHYQYHLNQSFPEPFPRHYHTVWCTATGRCTACSLTRRNITSLWGRVSLALASYHLNDGFRCWRIISGGRRHLAIISLVVAVLHWMQWNLLESACLHGPKLVLALVPLRRAAWGRQL